MLFICLPGSVCSVPGFLREQRLPVPLHLQGGRRLRVHPFTRCHDRLQGAWIAFAGRLHQPAGCPDVHCQFHTGPWASSAQWAGPGILGKHPISPTLPPKIVPHAHIVVVRFNPLASGSHPINIWFSLADVHETPAGHQTPNEVR